MKVLIIASAAAAYDHQGYFVELAKHRDIDLTILISPYWSYLAAGGFTFSKKNRVYFDRFGYNENSGYKLIKKLPLFNGKSYHLYLGLWKLLSETKPEVIEYIFEPWNLGLTQIILWRQLFNKNTKIVFLSHENIYQTYKDRFFYGLVQYGLIEKYNLRNVEGCAGATNEVVGIMRKKGFKGKTLVNGDELDPKVFYKKDSSALKKRLGINNFVVGFSGRLEESKGVMTLIEATGKIRKEDFTLLICGWSDSDFKERMIKRIAELGIKEKILLINKRLGRKIVDYYNLMDVIVIPSQTTKYWKEQFGRVNIEAMACGVPVIGSNSGSIPEVVGNSGLIFREKDSEDLKNKLLMIMKDKKLLKKLSLKSEKRFLDNFTCEKKATRSYKFYKKLLNDAH